MTGKFQNTTSQGRANEAKNATEAKSTAPEVRFTLPRLDSAQRTAAPRPPPPRHTKPDIKASGGRDFDEALQKLANLLKRRDEAKKANNADVEYDLSHFAIPDLKKRIEELKAAADQQKKADQEAAAPPNAVPTERKAPVHIINDHTNNESSRDSDTDSDSEIDAMNVNDDSERASAHLDLYD